MSLPVITTDDSRQAELDPTRNREVISGASPENQTFKIPEQSVTDTAEQIPQPVTEGQQFVDVQNGTRVFAEVSVEQLNKLARDSVASDGTLVGLRPVVIADVNKGLN
jgi:hypothetical protein